MPTVNPAAPTAPVATPDALPQGLSAEALLSYCASRLNSLDDLIASRFKDQQQRNTAIKEAGALITSLNAASQGIAANAKDTEQFHRDMGAGLAVMYNNTTDPQIKARVADAFKVFTGRDLPLDKNGKASGTDLDKKNIELNTAAIQGYSSDQWQLYIGGVKTLQDGYTKDSELAMITLQSQVSQRQQAVTLTTQMMSTLNEGSMKAINNIHS